MKSGKIGSVIIGGCIVLFMALVVMGPLGCSSSDSGEETPAAEEVVDLSGNWSFTITVTAAEDVCSGEVGHQSTRTITITQTDAHVVLDGFLGVPGNKVEGDLSQGTLVATGTYYEDGGYTTSKHTLVVSDKDNMSGQEDWWWTDMHVSCLNGKATVVATRIP